ncbi:ABC transporter ATP-binding protein [Polynucleobacter sp. AP-Ainpum-60-G11]|uniref:ABC transporter ATP-binding protein n=1 Tax=Polynucleobacter sp. AP-Ainpum-60-G11 TaxID=2576926 RepID=UPI001BFEC89B|nr:ABC transporter ATP-binding protein [Polynucleobacter sp. AP-Ainpum-60-G11]QWE26998.1 ABC transporter ATP-binding protein [Polynucleobacter sp. AP-Ainpum-60-G11]
MYKKTIKRINYLFTYFHAGKKFSFLFFLMITASLSEVVGLGSLVPFLIALSDPQKLYDFRYLAKFVEIFNIQNSVQLTLILTIVFCLVAILSGLLRIYLTYATTKFCFSMGSRISSEIYKNLLCQPYEFHIQKNSSDLISIISNKSAIVVDGLLIPALNIFSASTISIFIAATIIYISPLPAIAAFILFSTIYLTISSCSRVVLKKNSKKISEQYFREMRDLHEGFGGIRDVILSGTQDIYVNRFSKSDAIRREAQAANTFIGIYPRFAIEYLCLVVVAALAYIMSYDDQGVVGIIPTLGIIALGGQKLLPAMQQIYYGISSIRGSSSSLDDVFEHLDKPQAGILSDCNNLEKLRFTSEIVLNEVEYHYPNRSKPCLYGINLVIKKGSRLGIIGETGSGKSTLLDLCMQLLIPSGGSMKVDDVLVTKENSAKLQNIIAHVPQFIYLADASIAENIAFGVPLLDIDLCLLNKVIDAANLKALINDLPEGYLSQVGERGSALSGGQIQRIGIARALYRKSEILILDEATSALDSLNESKILESIDALGLNITIIMVAHRLTSLKGCSQIIELGEGTIRRVISYSDLMK